MMHEEGESREQILVRGVALCPVLTTEDIELFASGVAVLVSKLASVSSFKLLEFPTFLMKSGRLIATDTDAAFLWNGWATAAILFYNGGLNLSGRAAHMAQSYPQAETTGFILERSAFGLPTEHPSGGNLYSAYNFKDYRLFSDRIPADKQK